MLKNIVPLFFVSVTIACGTANADRNVASCSDKLSGEWEFGRAPYGCSISSSTAESLEAKYPSLTFDDTQTRANEKTRFTNEMYNFLSDYATAYFQRREPNASAQTVEEWTHLVMSTAHQESFWTHFRKGEDGMFRFFKGDAGHGYGLMQIDNRSHKEFIRSEKAFDLTENFIYALDMLYDNRASAIKKPCGINTDAKSISRSAYSAYNGGPGSKCRWTNPAHRWARNDRNFLQKYTTKSWEKTVNVATAN